ncbi:Na+/H+ antiporter NhaA [Frankia sp. AvcI1]|uniref:Na+/H+ antiporter NhaA n=1 Tax=Frankia sp. AvcI1 TaxID=573496 RepID=UPI0027E1F9B3|nr:Na+/H+ antiporter NhaA [Frankia sp. AvcI1]
MAQTAPRRFSVFDRRSWPEARRIAAILRREVIGGALLLAATVLAPGWANSPWSESYQSMLSHRVSLPWQHLNLNLARWAADGPAAEDRPAMAPALQLRWCAVMGRPSRGRNVTSGCGTISTPAIGSNDQ